MGCWRWSVGMGWERWGRLRKKWNESRRALPRSSVSIQTPASVASPRSAAESARGTFAIWPARARTCYQRWTVFGRVGRRTRTSVCFWFSFRAEPSWVGDHRTESCCCSGCCRRLPLGFEVEGVGERVRGACSLLSFQPEIALVSTLPPPTTPPPPSPTLFTMVNVGINGFGTSHSILLLHRLR